MKHRLKVALAVLLVLFLIGFVLWFPYEVPAIPEWKLQVLDATGRPVASVRVNQEWIDPVEDGIISTDFKRTDASGIVVFPKRILHNRLALHFGRVKRSTRAFLCPGNQYGAIYWDGSGALPGTLNLQPGRCPYG